MSQKLRMAVLFGNRDFFPSEVAAKARKEMSQAIEMVWVWSGYFVELDKAYQDHIIRRSELDF